MKHTWVVLAETGLHSNRQNWKLHLGHNPALALTQPCPLWSSDSSDLRDRALGKGEVVHQHIETLILFIQELLDPAGEVGGRENKGITFFSRRKEQPTSFSQLLSLASPIQKIKSNQVSKLKVYCITK